MTFASIMVAMGLTPESRDRARVAAHLADVFHARLIGVAADQPAFVVPPIGPTPGSAYVMATTDEAIVDDLRLAQVAFEEAVGPRPRVSWRSDLDFPLHFLLAQAAAADLVVLGREPTGGPKPFSVDPADAVMRLGLPALIVPPEIDRLDPQRIVIAWKNTREARRAVRDALPFLKRASHVDVIAIDDGQGSLDMRDVVGFLQTRNVPVCAVTKELSRATVGSAVIAAASERGADLIVAGAYGHGLLREWVFGGVTRSLLACAPVCCLLSH